MKPLCYGSPAFVDPRSGVCGSCDLTRACLDEASRALQSMPDTVPVRSERQRLAALRSPGTQGITIARSGRVSRALCAADHARLAAVPERVRGTCKRLLQQGWFDLAKENLSAGRPAPSSGNAAVDRVLDLLRSGISTRAELALAYAGQFAPSASVQVAISSALTVLEFARMVDRNPQRLSLMPN